MSTDTIQRAIEALRRVGENEQADQLEESLEASKPKARQRVSFTDRFRKSAARPEDQLKAGYQALAPLVDPINEVLGTELSLSEIASIIQVYYAPEARELRQRAAGEESEGDATDEAKDVLEHADVDDEPVMHDDGMMDEDDPTE